MSSFSPRTSVVLEPSVSSKNIIVPEGYYTLVVYNGGTGVLWMEFAPQTSVPAANVWVSANQMVVQPGTTQAFVCPDSGGVLSYISTVSGGTVVVTLGSGS